MKILYQGFPGAYSHLAAQEVFPEITHFGLFLGRFSISCGL